MAAHFDPHGDGCRAGRADARGVCPHCGTPRAAGMACAVPTCDANPATLVGEFIRIPAWRVCGQVVAAEADRSGLGSDTAIEIELQTYPEGPIRRYRIEPSEFEVEQEDLLNRALQHHGRPHDVGKWAATLAADSVKAGEIEARIEPSEFEVE